MKIKNRLLQLVTLFILLIVAACSGGEKKASVNQTDGSEVLQDVQQNKGTTGMHSQHNNLADNFAHNDIVLLDEVYRVNEQTKAELEEVIDAYLLLKDALRDDNIVFADKTIDLMHKKIKEVKSESWMVRD